MTLASLKLCRRHEKTCTEGYEKDFRVYAWMLEKQKGKKATVDCSCTIYAEGTLVRGVTKTYIRPKSTDKRTWTDAETVKATRRVFTRRSRSRNARENSGGCRFVPLSENQPKKERTDPAEPIRRR